LPRRRPQTWKVSDSPDSQEDENQEKSHLKKPNKNKDLKWHLTNLFLFDILIV